MSDVPRIYVMDSSSLIAMEKYYLRGHFIKFWKNFNELIAKDQIKTPEEVFDEVKRKSGELHEWMEHHRGKLLSKATTFSAGKVSEMVVEFPKMCKPNSPKTKADPFVVACAVDMRDGEQFRFDEISPVVVTEESPTTGKKEQIPDACKYYDMEYISVPTVIIENKWFF
jgi:hypothetical protein